MLEMSGLFIFMGILVGMIAGLSLTRVCEAFTEGFLTDDTVAIDETHIEARDRAPSKQEKAKKQPKRRGRKPKAERSLASSTSRKRSRLANL
jgi:transposase